MSPEPKNKSKTSWQPTATIETLKIRAAILKKIRQFFDERDVLEVETPLLDEHTVTDPYIESIAVPLSKNKCSYLQTSPEYAMKRLLASGSGSIYQITKAFRQDEIGKLHQFEFTLLEWYRINFNLNELMDEMDALLAYLLEYDNRALRLTYKQVFQDTLDINPHTVKKEELEELLKENHIFLGSHVGDIDSLLDILFSRRIEPELQKFAEVCFIYDYRATQAALARLEQKECLVASRFEVYYKGIELANGFHELNDPIEQRNRFHANQMKRKDLGLNEIAIDEKLLAALPHLPNCSGVALGLDRLIMLKENLNSISKVIGFSK